MPGRTLSPSEQHSPPSAEPETPSLRPLPSPAQALSLSRFSSWYPKFRRHAPKTTIIDACALEPGFLAWLKEDGIVLPEGSDGQQMGNGAHGSNSSDSDSDWDGEDDEEEQAVAPSFPTLDAAIRDAIARYDGAVFPKLDWSAPRDAAWMIPGNTLRCTTPADVYLLLKSSDFISKDVEQLQELSIANGSLNEVRVQLILKQFFIIPTSHEFRCFVRDGRLIAACQRDSIFFEHLQPLEVRDKVKSMLLDFWMRALDARREEGEEGSEDGSDASAVGLSSYVFDAYLTRDMSRVFLIDVNPWLERTDPLLWTWEEVEALAEDALQPRQRADDTHRDDEDDEDDGDGDGEGAHPQISLRILTSETQSSQSQRGPMYASNMVPSDLVEASEGRDLASFEREWKEQMLEAAREKEEATAAGR